jgi:hypothetical protein
MPNCWQPDRGGAGEAGDGGRGDGETGRRGRGDAGDRGDTGGDVETMCSTVLLAIVCRYLLKFASGNVVVIRENVVIVRLV